jgi:hypothetical protein
MKFLKKYIWSFIPLVIVGGMLMGANPTSTGGTRKIPDYKTQVLVASTSEGSVILNPDLEYILMHDGEDNTGASDSNTIYLSFSGSVDADASEGSDKAKLIETRSFPVGPGLSLMKFKTAAGGPTFTVIPGPNYFGKF